MYPVDSIKVRWFHRSCNDTLTPESDEDASLQHLSSSRLFWRRERVLANIVNGGHARALERCLVSRPGRWTRTCSSLWDPRGSQGAHGWE